MIKIHGSRVTDQSEEGRCNFQPMNLPSLSYFGDVTLRIQDNEYASIIRISFVVINLIEQMLCLNFGSELFYTIRLETCYE